MKKSLIAFMVVVLISAISSSGWCQPELVYSENGTIKRIDGVENSKPYFTESGEKKFINEGGTFSLTVKDDDILSFGYVPIDYVVKNGSKGTRKAEIAIGDDAKRELWNRNRIDSVLKIWDTTVFKKAYHFFCWYNPGSDTLPVDEITLIHEYDGKILPFKIWTEIITESRVGFPILFLWKDGEIIPPKSPWTENTDVFKSIIRGDQGSFEESISKYKIDKTEDVFGNKVIHYAAAFGQLEIMKRLLAEGVDAGEKNSSKMTPLLIASATGHDNIVDLLLNHDIGLLGQKDIDGRKALHYASYCGHEMIVKELVHKEKNVNNEDSFKHTPVDYAIMEGRDSIVGLLAASGAIMRSDQENQQLLLMGNISGNNYSTVSFLLEQKASAKRELYGTTPLVIAAGNSSLDLVTRLIDSGAEVNNTDKNSVTPLMSACLTGRPEVVKYLLEKGATVNKKSENGLSAIEAAVLRNDPDLIGLLISHGVDIETKDRTGKSPFWLAAMLGYRESMTKLLDAGAMCNLDHDKAIELMEPAFRYDIPEAVFLALDQCLKADFLFYSKYPSTWVAEYYSADEILELLLKHGAEKDERKSLGIVEATDLSEKPRILEATPIYYPMELKRKYGSRRFKVKVLIDDKGRVLFPQMVDSEIHELDKIVMETVMKWRFAPPKNLAGEDCSVIVQIPILLACEDIEKTTYEFSEIDEPPKPIKVFAPVYPVEMKAEGVGGRVVLELIIDENGIPEDIKINSLTHKGFADAAIATAKKYQFKPAYFQGNPVKVKIKLPIVFIYN